MKTTKQDRDLYREFQKSPILFVKKMWGLVPQPLKPEFVEIAKISPLENYRVHWFQSFIKGEHIAWEQLVILLAIEKALRKESVLRISVVSGHGIGKSTVLAWLILWYLFCFKEAQVPCTAPTSEQMHDILWKELSKWLKKMPEKIQNVYDYTASYLRIVESPEIWFARAKTARKEKPEALAGVHGDYVMLVVDEASGVPEEIFTTAEGSLTGENVLVIMISNGTRNEGYFYETHNDDSANWQNFSFSSVDSPVVEADYVPRIIDKYGRDSDEYKIRVAGQFPDTGVMDDQGYVPLMLKDQVIKSPDIPFVGKKRMGVDPAGEGDDLTSWCVRDSFVAKIVAIEKMSNSKSIAQKTITLMDLYSIPPKEVTVDNFGEGANVSQQLALEGKEVRAVNTKDEADDPTTYLNKRAEIHFRGRKWLIEGGVVTDDKLKDEVPKIKYKRNQAGKKQIMPKKDLRKDMKKSPDRGDSFFLTFYDKDKKERKSYKLPKRKDPWADG